MAEIILTCPTPDQRANRNIQLAFSLFLVFVSLWLLTTANDLIALYFVHAGAKNGIWATAPLVCACLVALLFSGV
jgi:hypothetical protein